MNLRRLCVRLSGRYSSGTKEMRMSLPAQPCDEVACQGEPCFKIRRVSRIAAIAHRFKSRIDLAFDSASLNTRKPRSCLFCGGVFGDEGLIVADACRQRGAYSVSVPQAQELAAWILGHVRFLYRSIWYMAP
jgi:hypothetical protein